ncbi:formate dehydrogenase accessory sulfurtransferase FdhD [Cumulibacter manganitolerans]|uniref:formate dehydrogenase accessory sulfurtransferase FdhD n=1 Tax=Cumulibacter manganitolerans TaxID=1884992 RepID=UPI00129726D4|nr:formate dehydrogenase accessory sulfurtransferase FdhD [Cumulibacter manganitolerans]
MSRVIARRKVEHVDVATGRRTTRPDSLAGEEPLEIRATGEPLTVTMRTPGSDVELVHGFLLSEGIIHSRDDVATARYCAGSVTDDDGLAQNTYNVMDVALSPVAQTLATQAVRSFATSSSCGVCGTASIDDVERTSHYPVDPAAPRLSLDAVAALPDRLRAQQRAFERTGGLHAAGLLDTRTDALEVREDVGRHNAADKVIGAAVMRGDLPASAHVLALSGRISFELVQKAAMAGIGMIVAVSAPSSLAVDLADRLGITLAGFVRGGGFNLYTHPDRVG